MTHFSFRYFSYKDMLSVLYVLKKCFFLMKNVIYIFQRMLNAGNYNICQHVACVAASGYYLYHTGLHMIDKLINYKLRPAFALWMENIYAQALKI